MQVQTVYSGEVVAVEACAFIYAILSVHKLLVNILVMIILVRCASFPNR